MRQIIGILLLVVTFGGLFVLMSLAYGWKETSFEFILFFIFTGLTVTGIFLAISK